MGSTSEQQQAGLLAAVRARHAAAGFPHRDGLAGLLANEAKETAR
jgi:hypothetical protein